MSKHQRPRGKEIRAPPTSCTGQAWNTWRAFSCPPHIVVASDHWSSLIYEQASLHTCSDPQPLYVPGDALSVTTPMYYICNSFIAIYIVQRILNIIFPLYVWCVVVQRSRKKDVQETIKSFVDNKKRNLLKTVYSRYRFVWVVEHTGLSTDRQYRSSKS